MKYCKFINQKENRNLSAEIRKIFFSLSSLKMTELCIVQSIQIEAEAVISKIMQTVHYLKSAAER